MGRDGGDTAQGGQNRRRSPRCACLLGNLLAERIIFFRRRSHQRDVGVVLIEAAIFELLGHAVEWAEVDHVESTERDDLRNPANGRPCHAILAGREDTADPFVGQFRRRGKKGSG